MRTAGTDSNSKRTYKIVTNNPTVAARWPHEAEVVTGGPENVYRAATRSDPLRHMLLTHPLAGSVKPNESPYRSVIVTRDPRPTVDLDSLRLIEAALSALDKLVASSGLRYGRGAAATVQLPPELDADYRMIDSSLMESAVQSLGEF